MNSDSDDASWFDAELHANQPCACRIDAPDPGDDAAYDDSDRLLLYNVRTYGWHIVQIEDNPLSPGWVFSVGMWHTLRSPEVAIFGLDRGDAANTINLIGERIHSGIRLGPDVVLRDVLNDDWPMGFRAVHPSWVEPLFGYARWFGRIQPPPIVQGVWADGSGRFPWDPAADAAYGGDQPSLWLAATEHPPTAWSGELTRPTWSFPVGHHTAAFTTRRVMHEGAPVLLVTHDHDGAWQFLDGSAQNLTVDDAHLTEIGRFVSQHPDLMELGDLPAGWQAWRRSIDEPWIRTQQ